MTETKKKEDTWQAIRGICIIAVVLIHCKSYNLEGISVGNTFYLIYRNLISFPVAIFFFLSGHFVHIREGYKDWLKARALKLVIPYFFWTLVYSVINLFLDHEMVTFKGVFEVLLLGKAAVPFYYCVVLIYYTLLTPLLIRLSRYRVASCLVCILSLSIQFIGYLLQSRGIGFFADYMRYTPVWLPFYYFGIKSRDFRSVFPHYSLQKIIPYLLAGSFALQLVETIILASTIELSPIAFSQMRVSSFCYSLSLLLFLTEVFRNKAAQRWLCFIGDCSYGIFFIHFLFIAFSSRVLSHYPIILPLYILIEAVTSIIGSIFLIQFLRKISKRNNYIRIVLGVG